MTYMTQASAIRWQWTSRPIEWPQTGTTKYEEIRARSDLQFETVRCAIEPEPAGLHPAS